MQIVFIKRFHHFMAYFLFKKQHLHNNEIVMFVISCAKIEIISSLQDIRARNACQRASASHFPASRFTSHMQIIIHSLFFVMLALTLGGCREGWEWGRDWPDLPVPRNLTATAFDAGSISLERTQKLRFQRIALLEQ